MSGSAAGPGTGARKRPPRPAPRNALLLLLLAPLIALVSALAGLVGSALLVPLLDPAPFVVWFMSVMLLRWQGVAVRPLKVAHRLSQLMMLEWAVADATLIVTLGLFGGPLQQKTVETLAVLWSWYMLEVVVLLVVFFAASLASIVSLRRLVVPPDLKPLGAEGMHGTD